MNYILSLLSLFFVNTLFHAQNYWQQEVNYKVDVTLDDVNHYLTGEISFEYINNSPDTLHFIFIHLWPNAYSNGETALANQLYQEGNDILKYVSEKNRGFIDSLSFSINDKSARWTLDEEHIDIAVLELDTPLLPARKITVHTPFRVKIPSGAISRLGHIEQSYQITQWYPKPAVYDKNGWHQMPYLNQGEFYSEFGSFDVSITLPKNYVVGATGDLQTASEQTFMDSLALATEMLIEANPNAEFANTFPASAEQFKTIRFKQSNVHDFAWFADKRFFVLKGNVELPFSKNNVDLYALFTPKNTPLWKKSIEYLHDATYYYSRWNGEYPYQQVTAVDGTISAGGGMEYPNVTVIGSARDHHELEVVIVHEVGHNWFYGILGTNERENGWMDEGLNTLNEVRYIQTKYPENTQLADMLLNGKFNFHGLNYRDMNDILTRSLMGLGLDQPIQTHSAEFTSINYGLVMYQKTGLVFDYLKYYLGETEFDKAMHKYFETWKFKHPEPKDLEKVLSESSAKDLSWLFDDLIKTSKQIDYKVGCTHHKHNKTITTVKNVGGVKGPIPVTASTETYSETKWVEPGVSKEKLTFDFEATQVKIDAERQLPEVNRQNNTWNKSRFINRIEPIRFRPLISYDRAEETNINWFPAFGYNTGDLAMLGAGIHNLSPSFEPWNYFIAPMYSFGRKNVSGLAEIFYLAQPRKAIKTIKYGVSIRSFAVGSPFENGALGDINTLSPYIRMRMHNESKRNSFKHTVHAQGLVNSSSRGNLRSNEVGGFAYYQTYYEERDHRFSFTGRQDYIMDITTSDQMSRLTIEAEYRFRYIREKQSRWITLRLFGGYNLLFDVNSLANQYRYGISPSGSDGSQDVFVEELFFDRGGVTPFLGNQRMENMGGFRSTSIFGVTDSWMTSANIYADLPIKLPIINLGVFVDGGLVDLNGLTYGLFNSGIGLKITDAFGVYFPILSSGNLLSLNPDGNYSDRIRVSLRLNVMNDNRLMRMLERL